MVIAYGSMKLDGCQRRQPINEKELFCHSALFKDVAILFGVAQSKGLHGQCVLKVFGIQAQVRAKPLRWHDNLALMKVNLIHKPDCGNVVPDALRRREGFQAMRAIQTLWLMFADE